MRKAAAFTPGPWWATNGGFIAADTGKPICQMWDRFDEDFENHRANKSAIAAMPDLYAALEQLVDWMGLRDNSGELVPIDKQPEQIAAAMRALAKAEGKDA